MRRLAIWAVLALVAAVCSAVAGAGPAWADGKGETATSLNVPSSAHYGQLVTAFGQVKDDSDSCNGLAHHCDLPAGSVSVFDGAAPTPFGTGLSLVNANPDLLGRLGSC